jgi:hypothetical protein
MSYIFIAFLTGIAVNFSGALFAYLQLRSDRRTPNANPASNDKEPHR